MQAYHVPRPKATEILTGPPRSGVISVYSTKLFALVFVILCAVVVWGNAVNIATSMNKCGSRCGITIAFAGLAWVYAMLLFFLNWLAERGTVSRNGCFSHGVEVQWIAILVPIWIPAVVATNKFRIESSVGAWFSWGGFFGSAYATFKAYHSFKEEDLPSRAPDGFEEESYVYG